MQINPKRIRQLNNHDLNESPIGGPIVYWMNRDIRAHDNWALLYAEELAVKNKVPLLVIYNLDPSFLGGGLRQYVFKIGALESVEQELKEHNIRFYLVEGKETEKDMVKFISEVSASVVVTDFSPLKLQRKWSSYIAKNIKVPMFEVDAHNIVPCFIASDKQEFGAYTLRPKLYRLLPEFLDKFPKLKIHSHNFNNRNANKYLPDWEKIKKDIEKNETIKAIDKTTAPIDWIKPSHTSANKLLSHFINHKLENYADNRNDPNQDAQSNLSPYLHYGILGSQTIALAIIKHIAKPIEYILDEIKNKAKIDKENLNLIDHAGAFLEELIVRKELSDNFCFYNENYDNTEGFPNWAKLSHQKHVKDKREYIYSKSEFENAKTLDELWNAAQLEMVKTGKMHGYMRMYWAKKILEWTKTPEDAMKIAIYLNDKYELDGRDPNGYAGIAWSIGGVHDRAWFGRPIFGQIRYMNAKGCASKFDTKSYISKWTKGEKAESGKLFQF